MTEADRIVKEAMDAALARNGPHGYQLLRDFETTETKPLLYWYALAECHADYLDWVMVRDFGYKPAHNTPEEFYADCNECNKQIYDSLLKFSAVLIEKHKSLLGFTGADADDPIPLDQVQAPLEIQDQERKATASYEQKMHEEAVICLRKLIIWRIGALKALGFDIYS